MKIRYSILCILLLLDFSNTFAQQAKFFIKSTFVGARAKEIEGVVGLFASIFADQIKQVHSCVVITTEADVGTMLGQEKQLQLLGSHSDIGANLGCDYLISIKLGVLPGDKFSVNAMLIPLRKKPVVPIARANTMCDYNQNPYPQIEANLNEVAQKLVDGLKNVEVCPFKGIIKVKVVSTTKDNQKEEYSVYCNQSDGIYIKKITIDNFSENDWAINKIGRETATGSVKLNLSEELTIEEENWCYECSPKKQGPRTYFEKITTYSDIQGNSSGGDGSGINVDSARVILTFLDNGSYTVRIKATSKQGTKKTIKEVKAQGVCDNSNNPPEKTTNKIDEGLYELLGPFSGSATDKTLSQKDTIKRVDPITKEETTITYEFNLTRE